MENYLFSSHWTGFLKVKCCDKANFDWGKYLKVCGHVVCGGRFNDEWIQVNSSKGMKRINYSCPSLVVRFLEELISRTFLDENQFRLVSQDRVRSQNRIGCLVFVSRTVLSCLTHSPLINAECQEDSIVFLLKRPKWISHRWNFEFLFVQDWSRHSISDKQRR